MNFAMKKKKKQRKSKKQRRKALEKKSLLMYGLPFLVGLLLVLYPLIGGRVNRYRCEKRITVYEETVAQTELSQIAFLMYDAREYNKAVAKAGATGSFASQAETSETGYEDQLDLTQDGMLAWLEIPAVSTSVPVARENAKAFAGKGIYHMAGSSLPAGEADSNCVIADSRGLPGTGLLENLNELQEGDYFYLHVLGQTFAYRVNRVQTAEKTDLDSVLVQSGEELVTLVGNGSGFLGLPGGKRLLVTGQRIGYSQPVYEAQAGKYR